MFFYSCFYLILTALLVASGSLHYNVRRCSYFFFFLAIFLVAGLRGDVGQDTFNYQTHYDSLSSLVSFFSMISRKEPFLYLLMYPHKILFDSFTGFLLIVSLFQVFLLAYATRNLAHRSLFLFVYLFVAYIEYHFNILRASFALLFFLCAISEARVNSKRAIAFLLLSLISHISIIFVFPVFLLRFKLSFSYIVFGVFFVTVFLVFFFYVFGDIFWYKVSAYGLFETGGLRVPKLLSFLVLCLWASLFLSKGVSSSLILSAFLFSVAFLYSTVSDIAYRIYIISFVVMVYLALEERVCSINRARIRPHFVAMLVLGLWLGGNIVYRVSVEKDMRLESGEGRAEFSFSPYSLYYDSKYRLDAEYK